MTSMVATAIDLREEVDDRVLPAQPTQSTRNSKGGSSASTATASPIKIHPSDKHAKFLIRTLHRDCSPAPTDITLSPSPRRTTSHRTAAGEEGERRGSGGMAASPGPRKQAALAGESTLVHDDNPFDDITESKLQALTGQHDLARVTRLQISVDAGKQSVEVIGELLPSLQHLRLERSTLHSFRDLGTSLHSLQTLWITRCGVHDLDGIGALTGLHELYLEGNAVSDISPLTMHDEIQVIDLSSNAISDLGQVEQLAFCPQLTTLNLAANPVCSIDRYRQIVANFVPQLRVLDRQEVTDHERSKLGDDIIDAAIHAFETQRERGASKDDGQGEDCRIGENSHTHSHEGEASSPQRGSQAGNSSRNSGSAGSGCREFDYGSTLTHGSDIVFAGNVTSALRRHRNETEHDRPSSPLGILGTPASGAMGGSVYRKPSSERPKTPARESITETLDRANELENHKSKSRDAILYELRAWQLESTGGSQVGVVSLDDPSVCISPSTSPMKRPESRGGLSSSSSNAGRRPNTSAGIVRREAFVENEAHAAGKVPSRQATPSRGSTPTTALPKRHSASSSLVNGDLSTISSTPQVDILILDESDPTSDDQRPCSPRKTARGVFTTSNLPGGDWNLDDIAPTLDRDAKTSFLQRKTPSSSMNFPGDRPNSSAADGDSSDSDVEDMRNVARQLKERRVSRQGKPPTSSTPTATVSSHTKGFFNVAESLHAIDRWRERMDDEETNPAVLDQTPATRRPRTPISVHPTASCSTREGSNSRPTVPCESDSGKLVRADELSPACRHTDEQIVQWMKEKHKNVAEIKTRDGFRRFFRGITEERLARILQEVFSDPEKSRRRMQLMQGFFHGQLG